MHNIDDQNLLVEAYIACPKIFKIPAKKVGKVFIGRTDETKSFQNIEDKFSVLTSLLTEIIQKKDENTKVNDIKSKEKITTSPQIKRKSSKKDSSSTESSSEEECLISMLKVILFS